MITSGEWLNPTRAVGLLAYGTATICCGIAWMRAKGRNHDGRLPAFLMLIEGVLLLDIAFDWRWMLHQFAMDFAQHRHEYQLRREPQFIAIVVLAALLLSGLLVVRRFFPGGGGASLAVSGVLLSLVLWCTEVVSLHAVDHVLYHPLGKIMAVSLLWILACLMTSIGTLSGYHSVKSYAGHDGRLK
jgi:hypothetical protein